MPGGNADIKAQHLSFEENQLGNADIRLNSNGQKITIETFKVRQAADRVDLQGSFDLKRQFFENVKLDIAVADVAAYTKNLIPPNQPINGAIRARPQAIRAAHGTGGPNRCDTRRGAAERCQDFQCDFQVAQRRATDPY